MPSHHLLKVKYLSEIAKEMGGLSYAHEGDAGMDIRVVDPSFTIIPGEHYLAHTGIAIHIDDPFSVALMFPRSGNATKKGIVLKNTVGVIDSGYTGEIRVALMNIGNEPVRIETGERVAQLILMPIHVARIIEVQDLENTTRGSGGFGSTDGA